MSCVIFTRIYGRSTTKNHCQNDKNAGKSSKKASEGEETFPVGFLGRSAGCPKKSSKKKRGGYTVLDPDRQLVPARRHPNQLPTIHLEVLFAFSFRESFFGVFQSFRRRNQKPRCFCHAPKGCHTQLMGQACLLHACFASSRSLRLRSCVPERGGTWRAPQEGTRVGGGQPTHLKNIRRKSNWIKFSQE